MSLDIKIKQNNFKAIVGQFTKRYQKIAAKLDNTD